MKFILLAVSLLPVLAACAANIVDHPKVDKSLSLWSVSCSEPYPTTRDCGEEWDRKGPQMPAEIDGYLFVFASSEDGRIIRVASYQDTTGLVIDLLSYGFTDYTGTHLEKILPVIEAALNTAGVNIVRVVPIIRPPLYAKAGDLGTSLGYFLELDGDGYAILSDYEVSEAVW
ncbi:MAG: hypothetical protein AAF699_05900 [Pseudomonadota bacterium]